MTVYIVEDNWTVDQECHDTRNDFFASLEDALKFAELRRNTKDYMSDNYVRILEMYPEYNYTNCLYEFYPENPCEDMEDYWQSEEPEDMFDPWEDHYYAQYAAFLEEESMLEIECKEWLSQNHNLPWECETMAHFVELYNNWGWRFGHPIYQTSGHKFRAFKWHISNDRASTKLLKAYYLQLSRLYGEAFVDSFIK